jgi:regulatory protein
LPSSAYIDALTMLARRELSEAQVRRRLARREHDADAIGEAVQRLKEERAIDDARVAGAIARTQTAVKGRGRMRVKRELERAGIGSADAKRALDEVFTALDDDVLIEKALARRLRGQSLEDEATFRRLYRYLMGQGFEHDRIMKALQAKQR